MSQDTPNEHWECYFCKGEGLTLQCTSEKYHHFDYITCQLCNGYPEFDEPHTDAQRLKNERDRWSVTQKEVARMLGTSVYVVRRIEKGERDAQIIRDFGFLRLEGWEAFSRVLMLCAADGGAPDCFKCWDRGTVSDGELRLRRGTTVSRSKICDCRKEEV